MADTTECMNSPGGNTPESQELPSSLIVWLIWNVTYHSSSPFFFESPPHTHTHKTGMSVIRFVLTIKVDINGTFPRLSSFSDAMYVVFLSLPLLWGIVFSQPILWKEVSKLWFVSAGDP